MATAAMIDLETLDTRPGCTILTLGGVKFNPFSSDEPHSEIYFKLDLDEQDRLGRSVSESTIEWWSKQDAKVQEEAFSDSDRVSVDTVVTTITKWMVGVDVLWGHGYGFDITILEDLYRSVGKPIPWNFWQVRDSRTLFACLKEDPRKKMQTDLHNALADAYYQAKCVQIAYHDLDIKR